MQSYTSASLKGYMPIKRSAENHAWSLGVRPVVKKGTIEQTNIGMFAVPCACFILRTLQTVTILGMWRMRLKVIMTMMNKSSCENLCCINVAASCNYSYSDFRVTGIHQVCPMSRGFHPPLHQSLGHMWVVGTSRIPKTVLTDIATASDTPSFSSSMGKPGMVAGLMLFHVMAMTSRDSIQLVIYF